MNTRLLFVVTTAVAVVTTYAKLSGLFESFNWADFMAGFAEATPLENRPKTPPTHSAVMGLVSGAFVMSAFGLLHMFILAYALRWAYTRPHIPKKSAIDTSTENE